MPPKHKHLIRYNGLYSSRTKGNAKKMQQSSSFRKGCIEGLLIFFLIFISIYIDGRRKRGSGVCPSSLKEMSRKLYS
jgi:hypothetical protein